MTERTIKVTVPATTANLGSGFDAVGMALNLMSEVYFTPDSSIRLADSPILEHGERAETLPQGMNNYLLSAMDLIAVRSGRKLTGGTFEVNNRIPVARGLGSSSAAIASGLLIGNELAGRPFNRTQLMEMACEMEGHPDNAAPAFMGGFCLSLMDEKGLIVKKIPVAAHWKAIVAIPEFELTTAKARSVLPDSYTRADAVHNLGAVSFLIAAFATDEPELLPMAFDDRIHVPYRLPLIPGAADVVELARKAGAYGSTISGSGSTMIAFSDEASAEAVRQAMAEGFAMHHIDSETLILEADDEGARLD
jgi:homoserine kinase